VDQGEDITPEEILEFVKDGVNVDVDQPIVRWQVPYEIKPRELLESAECDFRLDYDHHLLNALSNAKRAITCQIDNLICMMALTDRSLKEGWNFPRKIEILNRTEIISPPILSKVNRRRNLLEHEYRRPTTEEVEDAIGVAQLFISSTDRYLVDGIGEVAFYSDDGDHEIELRLDHEKKVISIEAQRGDEMRHKRVVSPDSEEYVDFLAIMVGANTVVNL
jgi:hypothetical protein